MENFLTSLRTKYLLLIVIIGLILISGGIIFFKSGVGLPETKVEVLDAETTNETSKNITVEISGGVINPGVYKLSDGSRIDDLLVTAGGFSQKADRAWADKYINRAAKLIDGQKVFIQQLGESTAKNNSVDQTASSINSTDSNGLININTASLKDLDSLPGIGQVYGQSIIEHRPYSNIEELLSKGVLKKSVYDKIKNLVSVY